MAVDQSVSMAKSRKRQAAAGTQEVPPTTNGNRDRIAARAYELYLARGGTHGADMEDWLNAEREFARSGKPKDRQESEE
jgi:hypothetical protein